MSIIATHKTSDPWFHECTAAIIHASTADDDCTNYSNYRVLPV